MGKRITILIIIFKFDLHHGWGTQGCKKLGRHYIQFDLQDVSGPTNDKMYLKKLLGEFSFFVS